MLLLNEFTNASTLLMPKWPQNEAELLERLVNDGDQSSLMKIVKRAMIVRGRWKALPRGRVIQANLIPQQAVQHTPDTHHYMADEW